MVGCGRGVVKEIEDGSWRGLREKRDVGLWKLREENILRKIKCIILLEMKEDILKDVYLI